MKQLLKWEWPAILVVAMACACGGDSKSKDSSAASFGNQGESTPSSASVKGVFDKLEASGQLPVLDRSDSIAGPDVNANGVRDDIERHIDGKPDNQPQKNSLKSLSRALSKAMTIDTKDKNALREVTNSINISTGCIWETYPSDTASRLGREIEKLTVNTRRRYDAYMKYNSAMNGAVISEPKELNCD